MGWCLKVDKIMLLKDSKHNIKNLYLYVLCIKKKVKQTLWNLWKLHGVKKNKIQPKNRLLKFAKPNWENEL